MIDRHKLFADCLGVVLEMRRCDLHTVTVPSGCGHTRQVLADTLASRPAAAVVNADLGPQCDSTDEAQWGHCLAAGARIVVPKHAGLTTLVSVIGRLSRGERVLDAADRERLLRVYRLRSAEHRERRARLARLSANEAEILLHLMQGRTVREVAALRVVSEATVRTQVKSVLGKLEVGSQLSAVALAHAAGWDASRIPAAS